MLNPREVFVIQKAINNPGELNPKDMADLRDIDPGLSRAALAAWRKAMTPPAPAAVKKYSGSVKLTPRRPGVVYLDGRK